MGSERSFFLYRSLFLPSPSWRLGGKTKERYHLPARFLHAKDEVVLNLILRMCSASWNCARLMLLYILCTLCSCYKSCCSKSFLLHSSNCARSVESLGRLLKVSFSIKDVPPVSFLKQGVHNNIKYLKCGMYIQKNVY